MSVADGVLSLMSLYVDEYLATGERAGPGHDILTGRYACYDVYQCARRQVARGRRHRAAFCANLCRRSGCEQWIPHQTDDARQDEIRDAFRAVFATRDRDEWVAALAPADTCVAPVYAVAELVDDPHFRARQLVVDATHPTHGPFRQLGPLLAGMDRGAGGHTVPDPAQSNTDALLRDAGMDAAEVARLRGAGVIA